MRRFTTTAAVLLLTAAAHAQAPVGNHALDMPIGPSASFANNFSGNAMYGWQFTVNAPIQVTTLDVWASQGQFLDGAHKVGIWNASGTQLTAAIVSNISPSHPGLSPLGVWRYGAVAPTLLTPGVYTIGALYGNGGDIVVFGASPVTIPQISYLQPAYSQGPSLIFSQPAPAPAVAGGFFGPSFHAIAVNSPEPGTFALVGVGIVGVASNVLIRRVLRVRAQPS